MYSLILAAGYGNRLHPITKFIAKPLLPIVHTPLIDVIANVLKRFKAERIGVNLYYKADEIRTHLAQFNSTIDIAVEDTLRGTGGALLNFQYLFDQDFVVHACDILSQVDIGHIFEVHKSSSAMATIVLIQRAGTNIFRLAGNRVVGISDRDEANAYTYAGIGVFSPKIFPLLPDKTTFTTIDVFNCILSAGEEIIGIPYTSFWHNVNSVYSYWRINQKLLNKDVLLPEIAVGTSTISLHSSSTVKTDRLSGFVLVGERCTICRDVTLHNTIVLNDTTLKHGSYRNNVVSSTFCIEIDEE